MLREGAISHPDRILARREQPRPSRRGFFLITTSMPVAALLVAVDRVLVHPQEIDYAGLRSGWSPLHSFAETRLDVQLTQ